MASPGGELIGMLMPIVWAYAVHASYCVDETHTSCNHPIRILLESVDFSLRGTVSVSSATSGLVDYWRNILVEREVLDSNSSAAASHVELLVNGSHLLSKDINLFVGERLKMSSRRYTSLSSGFTFR